MPIDIRDTFFQKHKICILKNIWNFNSSKNMDSFERVYEVFETYLSIPTSSARSQRLSRNFKTFVRNIKNDRPTHAILRTEKICSTTPSPLSLWHAYVTHTWFLVPKTFAAASE